MLLSNSGVPVKTGSPEHSAFLPTTHVQFNWQQWKDPEPLVFASNAFPFEAVPGELWDAGEPGDWTPNLMEPCSFSLTGTAKDWNYDDYQWYHKLRLHDVLCNSKWNTVICETATGENMMQNRQERGQANLMQKAQERGQANLMQKAQERGQANLMHNAQERGQATLMQKAQERGQADERR